MTDRLSALDTALIYADDASAPRHVGGVMILEPTEPFHYQDIVDLVAQRLAQLPRFRQVVTLVPGRLARPVWSDDSDFDLSYHVPRSSLPAPGSKAQLHEHIGRILSRKLDRSRPLWELHIVEGLQDGRVALVSKTHEVLVGSFSAVDIAATLLDTAGTAETHDGSAHDGSAQDMSGHESNQPPALPWVAGAAPSPADLVIDAVADILARPAEALNLVAQGTRHSGAVLRNIWRFGMEVPTVVWRTLRPTVAPALTVAEPGKRVFDTASLDLQQIKAVRAVHGGSINDVVLAVIAGAVRAWLLSHGDPVAAPPSVSVLAPLSIQADSDAGSPTVASHMIDLPITEPNPIVRLQQISFAMADQLDSGQAVGAAALLALGRLAPPTLHALGARVAARHSARSYDILVTNVPGPQEELIAAGYDVSAMYPIPPLAAGHALALACTSYHGTVCVGITADEAATGVPGSFATLLSEALAEMVATTRGRKAS